MSEEIKNGSYVVCNVGAERSKLFQEIARKKDRVYVQIVMGGFKELAYLKPKDVEALYKNHPFTLICDPQDGPRVKHLSDLCIGLLIQAKIQYITITNASLACLANTYGIDISKFPSVAQLSSDTNAHFNWE